MEQESPSRLNQSLVVKFWPSQLVSPTELLNTESKAVKLGYFVRAPIASRVVLQIIGGWSYLLARTFNSSRVFNRETFNNEVFSERIHQEYADAALKTECPLLTISNHISCIDDPVLWGCLLPLTYYSLKPERIRWSAAAHDICFSKQWHSHLFSLGKTFPIVRGKGIHQPAMEFALALLKRNQWVHFFPEGKVMKEGEVVDRGYLFKWGVSRLILDYLNGSSDVDSRKSIRILPFYHVGMDEVLPLGRPYVPRIGKKITIFFRERVIDMDQQRLQEILNCPLPDMQHTHDESAIKRIKFTKFLETEMEKLKSLALKEHKT